MKLEQQVCSLELAKKLKELGVKQESLYFWSEIQTYQPNDGNPPGTRYSITSLPINNGFDFCSAFTVAELGEMLPTNCDVVKQVEGKGFKGSIDTDKCCEYCGEDFYKIIDETLSSTEADARAAMLIYLLENKLTPL